MDLSGKVVLVTGGAGAIGSALVENLLKTKGDTHTIRVFDSDEYGIWQLQQKLLAEGKTDPIYHGLTRPPILEAEEHSG